MKQQQEQSPFGGDFFENINLAMGLLYWFCAMWAFSVEIFLRRSFGLRYFGFQVLALIVWIPTFIVIWQQPDAVPLLWYLPAMVMMLTAHRINAFLRWWRGEIEHSYYSGWPHVMRFCGRLDELKVKTFVEPCLVLVIAGLVYGLVPGVGAFFLGAGISLAVKGIIDLARDAMFVMDTHDAHITQRWLRGRLGRF